MPRELKDFGPFWVDDEGVHLKPQHYKSPGSFLISMQSALNFLERELPDEQNETPKAAEE